MAKCVNINHPDFLGLVDETGMHPAVLSAKMGVWMEQNNTDEWPNVDQLNKDSVNYVLKIVDSLSKLNRSKFESSKLQGWLNDLQKQGVSKDQLSIFQEVAKNGMTKDDIIISILADYSYVININIAKNISGKPTKFYENIRVPGGTNYTENEIVTPSIKPIVKGHGAFSTENGIGWFRSDEPIVRGSEGPFQEDGAGGLVRTSISKKDSVRILEIQSDLFQKNRDKKIIVTLDKRKPLEVGRKYYDTYTQDEYEIIRYEEGISGSFSSEENQYSLLLQIH